MSFMLATPLLFLLAHDANGAEYQLQDGTVVIGSIVRLVDGEDLVVDTENMDEVTIDWDASASVRGTQLSFGGGIGYDGTDFETSINATTIINE